MNSTLQTLDLTVPLTATLPAPDTESQSLTIVPPGSPPTPQFQIATVFETLTQPVPAKFRNCRRNGAIARLPKLERDMVCRMMSNGYPYRLIVDALDEVGLKVTERNLSNWAQGGYLEWRLEQEQVVQNRVDQDALVDHVRHDDATDLSEAGLQNAAARISQLLLRKAARDEDLEANLGSYTNMVNLLCRLNRELFSLQKYRDDSARNLGRTHDPLRIKKEDQKNIREVELGAADLVGTSRVGEADEDLSPDTLHTQLPSVPAGPPSPTPTPSMTSLVSTIEPPLPSPSVPSDSAAVDSVLAPASEPAVPNLPSDPIASNPIEPKSSDTSPAAHPPSPQAVSPSATTTDVVSPVPTPQTPALDPSVPADSTCMAPCQSQSPPTPDYDLYPMRLYGW